VPPLAAPSATADRLRRAPNGCWKEPDIASIGAGIGVSRDKDQLEYIVGTQTRQIEGLKDEVERLRDFSSGANGADVAVSTLVQIVSDTGASPRQRIKASGAILGYRVQDDKVIAFVRGFLETICISDIAIDHRTEAAELLRKLTAPRVMSEIVRPDYRDDDNLEPPEPLKDLVARRRARADAMQAEMVLQMERERALAASHALPSDVSSTQHDCNTENKDLQ
jgi:hypothetical protein